MSWSYTGAISLNSSWRSSAASALNCSSGRPVTKPFSRVGAGEAVAEAVSPHTTSSVVVLFLLEPLFSSERGGGDGKAWFQAGGHKRAGREGGRDGG